MGHNSFVIALIGILGVGAQWVAWRTNWPAIALLLFAGLVAGPLTGIIQPQRDFGAMLDPAISIAVAIILFVGGLSLNFRELRHAEGAVSRLVLIGVPLAWVMGALTCYYVAGLVWPVAILFSGILVVTGPTVVIPLLRQLNIGARPRAALKWEAIVNDPIGALFAVVTYEYLLHAEDGGTVFGTVAMVATAAIAAGLIGFAAAYVIAWLFPRGHVPEFLKSPVLLVMVIGAFVLSNMVQQETGLLAVTVMGVSLANMRLEGFRDFQHFKENITVLLVSGVFILLSASLNLDVLKQFEWRFIGFVAVLLLVVRPASVLASLAFSRMPWPERLFIAWIAPRGIVAVAVSGLFALRLNRLGYGDGFTLVALSFAVVGATIVAHGFTARLFARWLGIEAETKQGVLIVGATSWSLSLAEYLRQQGVPVTLSETSWQRLSPARAMGIPSFHGEILSEAAQDRIDLGQFQLLVATTDNEAYNALVCTEFAPELGRDAVYQLGSAAGDDPRHLPKTLRGRALFASGLGVEDLRAREQAGWTFRKTKVGEQFDFDAVKAALPDEADLLLLLRKNGTMRFFTHASRPTPEIGDTVISYAPPRATRQKVTAGTKGGKPSDPPALAAGET
ncbi:MAG TPA: sodium:proton antiporter [Sphingomonadaceae bacterium]|nr:sodium:proton antiporter [Sphingomonadaceae bacterium]